MSKPAQKSLIFTSKTILLIGLKMAYYCCFSLGQKSFITSTTEKEDFCLRKVFGGSPAR